ncbi:hypothetical protein [Saccharothrix xinjiangensis]|uniref:Anti-sigma-D factor RsdA-like protein n=1 Tax=Saccharothrix xinjiangensis TaxID=204798 RepID=A0ABV9Y838_9PSEU
MSNDDKRRRRDGSTEQLSVADLIARRETETQPIPRITEVEPETVRFKPTTSLSGRELHITELLRREGRAGEEERGGGLPVPKLVAMAGGGVVLAGAVAFTASSLVSSPDERPLAEVRFDARQAARATNTLTKDLTAATKQQEVKQAEAETTTAAPERTTTQRAPRVNQPQQRQAPAPQAPSTTTQAPGTTTDQTTTTAPSTSTTTPPPGNTSTPPPPPPPSSSSTAPSVPSSPSSPSSTDPSTPPPSSSEQPAPGLGIGLDLGGILEPIGGFDFFAPSS